VESIPPIEARGRGVITGSGAVSPLGRSADEFYRRLTAGERAIRDFEADERGDMQATQVASFRAFSPQPEIPAMKARRLDRGSQFALIACAQAVAEAGFRIADDPEAIGIAMGTGSAGAGALTEFLRVLFLDSPEAAPPFHFPNTVANAPASQTSIELKIFGPNVTITQKDPSALNALLFSALALSSGRAKAMLAGAVDEWNFFYAMGFDRVGALKGAKRASGIVQGEGAFVVLLEDEPSARARGATPLARLTGIATAGVASEPYRFAPDARAIGRAIRGALADAGRSPGDVDLWLPSRDGVVEMDRAEADVMRSIFGERLPAELSVKDAIGEMAAAGGAQIVAAARALAAGQARCALVNSFGAGGNFLAAVLEAV
jgi:3-oxoacyl-(acyl-carrier-protein) synthase